MKKISVLNLSPTQHLSEIYHGFLNTHVPGYAISPYQPEKKGAGIDALIVIGANSDPGKMEKIRVPEEKIFVYNLEHLTEGSHWLKTRYSSVLSKYNLIDFTKANDKFYGKYCKKIDYLPVPLFDTFFENSSKADQHGLRQEQKSYDVLIFGAESPRRRNLHNKLLSAGITSIYVTDLWGDARLKALRQARTVLNVHISSNFALETTRLNWVLSNGTRVISEHSPHDPLSDVYKETVELLPYDQIVEYYESNIGRIRSPQFHAHDIKSTKMYENLEPSKLLGGLFERLTSQSSSRATSSAKAAKISENFKNNASVQQVSTALFFGRYHSSDFSGSPHEKHIKEIEAVDPLLTGSDLSRASQIATIKRLLQKEDVSRLMAPIASRIVFTANLAANLTPETLSAIQINLQKHAPKETRDLADSLFCMCVGKISESFALLRKTSVNMKLPEFAGNSLVKCIEAMSWKDIEQAFCGFLNNGLDTPVLDETWNGLLLSLIAKARSLGLHACANSLKKMISSYVGLTGAQAGLLAAVAYEVGNAFEARTLAFRAKVDGFEPNGIKNLIASSSSSIAFSGSSPSAIMPISSSDKVLEHLLRHPSGGDAHAAHKLLSNDELRRSEENKSQWRKVYSDGKYSVCVNSGWLNSVQNTAPVCLLGHYNESDIIEWSIDCLARQGFNIVVVDNWSDASHFDKLTSLQEKYNFEIVRFPEAPAAAYEWGALLKFKEELAQKHADTWVAHQDADEIRLSSCPGLSFSQLLNYSRALGFTAIDHVVMNVRPLDNSYTPEKHPFAVFTAFQFGSSDTDLQVKTWVQGKNKVDLSSSGGHLVDFIGRKIFPLRQYLFHFPLRNAAQAEAKIFKERLARFKEEERNKGWHAHYDKYLSEKFKFWERSTVLPLENFSSLSHALIHRKNAR